MFVKNSCVHTYTPYIEALLLWPGDIKSDGRNLQSMFASLDLNQPWPRGDYLSLFQKECEDYIRAQNV